MAADGYTLVIGDKNFSSWSLRPWIAMKHFDIPFAEERMRLRQPESKAAILRHSPSGKVPALKTNGLVVCDSLAILEYLAEHHPEHQMWPQDHEARAVPARSRPRCIRASSRSATRCPWICSRASPPRRSATSSSATFGRIVAIWRGTRARYGAGGPFLFGAFAMPTPCTRRWRRASARMASISRRSAMTARRSLCRDHSCLPAMAEWTAGAEAEIRARLARLSRQRQNVVFSAPPSWPSTATSASARPAAMTPYSIGRCRDRLREKNWSSRFIPALPSHPAKGGGAARTG